VLLGIGETRQQYLDWITRVEEYYFLQQSVSTYVQEKSIAADKAALGILKSIDVVLGGDHGQGKFRSVITTRQQWEAGG
jgi:hypothetical protein